MPLACGVGHSRQLESVPLACGVGHSRQVESVPLACGVGHSRQLESVPLACGVGHSRQLESVLATAPRFRSLQQIWAELFLCTLAVPTKLKRLPIIRCVCDRLVFFVRVGVGEILIYQFFTQCAPP